MREENLLVQVKRYCRTSKPGVGSYPNLLRDLEVDYPDQAWCGDITYIQVRRGFVYLAVLMDVFTRSIRGWELSRGLEDDLTVRALEKAFEKGTPEIHHSDHGLQYLSERYLFSKTKEITYPLLTNSLPKEVGQFSTGPRGSI